MNLSENWTKYLVEQPETGMGFQIVNVEFEDGTKCENVVVKNASEIDAQNFPESEIKNIELA